MSNSDEIFRIAQGICEALPARSMRDGLLGKNLEDALQTLLEENPNLIPGKQIAPSSEHPPKFVLLRREMPISGWSLDHLFVDQYAVPTLVEAKLVQNPESRREVIGQIIEYAANSSDLWSEGKARSFAEDFHRQSNRNLSEVLSTAFGSDLDVDSFWQSFDDNLQEGKIRLIIAGDEIRPEVRRMIEYLNFEMTNAEVFGLEISCYGQDEHNLVIVPRIIGQTQATADRKSERRKTTRWTTDLIDSVIQEMDPGIRRDRYRAVFQWTVSNKVFCASTSKVAMFSALNRYSMRQVGFNISGGGYIGLAAFYFEDNLDDRNFFFEEIKKTGLINIDESIEDIKDGRSFAKNLDEITNEEFDSLLNLLQKMI